jgi:hypothetical protein
VSKKTRSLVKTLPVISDSSCIAVTLFTAAIAEPVSKTFCHGLILQTDGGVEAKRKRGSERTLEIIGRGLRAYRAIGQKVWVKPGKKAQEAEP